jgi:hypothetical protein
VKLAQLTAAAETIPKPTRDKRILFILSFLPPRLVVGFG